jgi:hypothetical protein
MFLVGVSADLPGRQRFDIVVGIVAEIGRFLGAVRRKGRKLIFFDLKSVIFI